jgi:hypothetical protein
MATGYTQTELDALLLILEDAVPRRPSKKDKKDADHITAMRFAGTERGVLGNFEAKSGKQEIYWLNCWVAKELAAAISAASRAFDWPKRVLAPRQGEHLAQPKLAHLAKAIGVNSLSTSADAGGLLTRFAVGHRVRYVTLYFSAPNAHQLMLAIAQAARVAEWWDPDTFELIPCRESQQ